MTKQSMDKTRRKLARKVNRPPAATRNAPTGPWIVGAVTAVSLSTASLTATIHGDTVAIPGINYLDSYTPNVGDNVIMVRIKQHLWAIGTVAAYSGGTASGWVTQAYGSGFSAGPVPPYWRIVGDNGTLKVQFKGQITVGGSPGPNFWVLPSIAWPTGTRLGCVTTNVGQTYVQIGTSGGVFIGGGYGSVTLIVLDGVEYFID